MIPFFGWLFHVILLSLQVSLLTIATSNIVASGLLAVGVTVKVILSKVPTMELRLYFKKAYL